jgi:S1-C subfamily serine protease
MLRPAPSRPAILLGLPATLTALLASSTLACAQARPAPSPAPAPKAERREQRAESRSPERRVQVYRFGGEDEDDRAVIGLSTASFAGKRDTLGVLVQSVSAGGPAETAGIEEGDRIAAINGVSLRLSPEDAGEPDVGGLMTHRLRREMDKVKPGATVELSVWSGGQTKTLRVPTVAADSLRSRSRVSFDRTTMEERAVLGLNVSASGSRRDTLGALVSAVATDGPAEKAGIVEGDRIATINGVDLRVAREDAGDPWASGVKLSRFQRELRKVKAGDAVELRVVTAGQARTVRVTAAKAKDVYKSRADGGMRFQFGELADGFGGDFVMPPMPAMPPMPRMAPMPAIAPMPPMPPADVRVRIDDGDYEMLRSLGERYRTLRPGVMRGVDGIAYGGSGRRGRIDATLSGEGGTLNMSGLRLTRVNADLASYFGSGAEGGLLVTSNEGDAWKNLREGDVIISVNGTPVRQGDRTRLSLDSRERTELEVLRKGKREKIVIDGEK